MKLVVYTKAIMTEPGIKQIESRVRDSLKLKKTDGVFIFHGTDKDSIEVLEYDNDKF